MAGIVVGRIRVDNYLLQYVVTKNGSMINLTKNIKALLEPLGKKSIMLLLLKLIKLTMAYQA